MATRILAVSTVLLAALFLHEYSVAAGLRASLVATQAHAAADARAALLDALADRGRDVRAAIGWLDGYYRSADGLQRSNGICEGGRVDGEALGAWIFDVYLQQRLSGDTDEQARAAIVAAIQRSGEWQSRHRP